MIDKKVTPRTICLPLLIFAIQLAIVHTEASGQRLVFTLITEYETEFSIESMVLDVKTDSKVSFVKSNSAPSEIVLHSAKDQIKLLTECLDARKNEQHPEDDLVGSNKTALLISKMPRDKGHVHSWLFQLSRQNKLFNEGEVDGNILRLLNKLPLQWGSGLRSVLNTSDPKESGGAPVPKGVEFEVDLWTPQGQNRTGREERE